MNASLDKFLLRRNTRLAFFPEYSASFNQLIEWAQLAGYVSREAYRAHFDSAQCTLESGARGTIDQEKLIERNDAERATLAYCYF